MLGAQRPLSALIVLGAANTIICPAILHIQISTFQSGGINLHVLMEKKKKRLSCNFMTGDSYICRKHFHSMNRTGNVPVIFTLNQNLVLLLIRRLFCKGPKMLHPKDIIKC